MDEGSTQFTFYKSYLESAKGITDEAERGLFFYAVAMYMIDRVDVSESLPPMAKCCFECNRPHLDSSIRKSDAAKRSKAEQNGAKPSKTEQKKAEREQEKEQVQEKEQEQDKEKEKRKSAYGEHGNVMLTDEEIEKLRERVSGIDRLIETMSNYMESSGKRYKSHYAALLNWARRDGLISDPSSAPRPPGMDEGLFSEFDDIDRNAEEVSAWP